MTNPINPILKEYFDVQIKALSDRIREAETLRNESLNRAAERLQDGLNKAEKQLQIALIDAEKRVNEKLEARDKANDKADAVLNERLAQMNQFRDQISAERLLYVTRDQQDLTLKSLRDQVDILKRSMELSIGKDAGISKVWGGVAVAFSVTAAIGTGIMAVANYFQH